MALGPNFFKICVRKCQGLNCTGCLIEWVSLDFEALTFSDQDGHAGVPFTVLSTGNFEQ